MRSNFVGVFGHVVLDHLLRVPRLPRPGLTVPVERHIVTFGGTAGNVARVAGHLGVPVALASFVGEDFPDDYRQALAGEGVDLGDLRAVPGFPTPQAWILNGPREEQAVLIDQGPMAHGPEFELQEHAVRDSSWIHLGTGQPAYYRRVAELAKDLGKSIAFDPSQEIHYMYHGKDLRALMRAADIFFGNDLEVKRALELLGLERPRDLLTLVDTVVWTRGSKGSTILVQGETKTIPSVPAKVADVTGAGDAYRAGFYGGLHRGWDLERCGRLGAVVASFILEGHGPQANLPTWDLALHRLEEYEAGFG